MTDCARNNRCGSDLDYLDDEQFEELLVHAATCKPCDELLLKYENDLMPMLKLAIPEELVSPVTMDLSRRSHLNKPWTFFGQTVSSGFCKVKGLVETIVRKVYMQPVHALGATLFLSITIYGIVDYGKSYLQPLRVNDYLSLAEIVKVDWGGASNNETAEWIHEVTRNTPAIEVQDMAATTPALRKRRAPNGPKVSVIVDNIAYQGDEENTNQGFVDNVDKRSDEVIVRGNPSYALVQIRLITNPEEYKYIKCTLTEEFGKPSVARVIHRPPAGVCAWELPLLRRYELVISNSVTGLAETRSIYTQDNDVQVLEVRLDGKNPEK